MADRFELKITAPDGEHIVDTHITVAARGEWHLGDDWYTYYGLSDLVEDNIADWRSKDTNTVEVEFKEETQ